MTSRPSWDEYFMAMLSTIRLRATCDRGKSAALIVDEDRQIVSSGYVGSPPGMPHCDALGHLFEYRSDAPADEQANSSRHCVRTIHAEMNAIAQAAKRGVSTKNCTLYTHMEPCWECAKLIVQSGIQRVVAQHRYQRAERTRELFKNNDVQLDVLEDELSYEK
jgi:dCMP deaminase